MNSPGIALPSNATPLAAALGIALAVGISFASPLAAQEKTATQLDQMEQQMAPPPVIEADADAERSDVPRSEDRADARWSQLDSDGDGRISRSEGSVDRDFDSNFEMMDADSDGYISATEQGARDAEDVPEPEEEDEQG